MRIRTFILATSAAVAVMFFGGSLVGVTRAFDTAAQAAAEDGAKAMAHWAFASMYEVMSRGWNREQAERYFAAMRESSRVGSVHVQIYRGPLVVARFGEIAQPPMDAQLLGTLADGRPRQASNGATQRDLFPLVAEEKCLRCHENATVGATLGAIEVSQDLSAHIATARATFLRQLAFLLPLAAALAIGAVLWVNRRLEHSLRQVERQVSLVNGVGDLRSLALHEAKPGFAELDRLFAAFGALVAKMRAVAIDKEILRFEIGLVEKSVITSEVIRDWRSYVSQFVAEINRVVGVHMLFSLFRVDDDLFDLEVFWHQPPDENTRRLMEDRLREAIARQPHFSCAATVTIGHHVTHGDAAPLSLEPEEIELRVKSCAIDNPKISGIVGVCARAGREDDDTRDLVLDSMLSTLINVVGSVKAIYKYTSDLEHYGTRDPLTDLFNQRMFWEQLVYEIERARRRNCQFALLIIDLDNFKLINDNYGHAVGDRFLREFALKLRHALRAGDILARYGGDEFVAILPEADLTEAHAIALRALNACRDTAVRVEGGGEIRGSASVGIAVYPEHAVEPRDLFLFADNMLYKAKSTGKKRVALPSADDLVDVFRDISKRSVTIISAVESRRIVPHFQPIVEIGSKRVAAFEVLSRLDTGGTLLEADEFIEIAEKVGVIHRLDCLMLELALRRVSEMPDDTLIFFNISPRSLVFSDFAPSVRSIVSASGVPHERIVFEITERDTVKNFALLERFIGDLKADGFRLAIDDFGSGFSSFQYLRSFPVDFLKLEGDFVRNIGANPKDRAFVHHIRALAHEMGIRVIAEYVENAEVYAELDRMGVDLAQGYYVGKPGLELAGEKA